MASNHRALCVLFALAGGHLVFGQSSLPQLGKSPVKEVIASMSLEEKSRLVVGMGMNLSGMSTGAPVVGDSADLVPGSAGSTFGVPRLGIPRIVVADGPAGLRISPQRPGCSETFFCTAFPVGSLLASSWDPQLVEQVGSAMGNEVLEYGVDVLLAPGLNLQKNPLCGRNFEYFSEDPMLSGKIAAAYVRGIQSQGVGTSIKHFAANNAESNRMALDTIVSQRALRELYLEGFRIVVQEAQPWTVMSSYNLINGTFASESRELLTDVLRTDWGFQGMVMTDWYAGKSPVAQMAAGNDLIMPGKPAQSQEIAEAVRKGTLSETQLDENVGRILALIQKSPHFRGYKPSDKPDLKLHAEVARIAARDGMVLLRNEGGLPLAPDRKHVALFGCTSYGGFAGGTGSGYVNRAYFVSLYAGLKDAGFAPNESLHTFYASYLQASKEGFPQPKPFQVMMGLVPQVGELTVSEDLARSMARCNDVAIITLGRNAGEGKDRQANAGDFLLTPVEHEMLRTISSAFHQQQKKVVVVLNIGGVIETESWRDQADAILLAWQGGQETGAAVTDLLVGKASPSGKLAISFPRQYRDVPDAERFPGKPKAGGQASGMPVSFLSSQPSSISYNEGLFVGYRFYETFKKSTSYEFGFGLSYTSFEYGVPELSAGTFGERITVTVLVRNSGSRTGREIVQLYLTAPAGGLDKPLLELKGFAKTVLLQPGQAQRVSFVLDPRQLSSFDPVRSSWVAAAGTYVLHLAASSRDIRKTVSFDLKQEIVVKAESQVLRPLGEISELRR